MDCDTQRGITCAAVADQAGRIIRGHRSGKKKGHAPARRPVTAFQSGGEMTQPSEIRSMLVRLGFHQSTLRDWSAMTPNGQLTVQEIRAPIGSVYALCCWPKESSYIKRLT